jgi:tRNA(Ser,Leu) C12 N-acetylase TAN1
VNTNLHEAPKLRIRCRFNEKEIRTAKKCILNGKKEPPNFTMKEMKLDNRSVFSKSKKSSKAGGKSKNSPNVEKDLEDFGDDPDILFPMERSEGVWM